MILLQQLSVLVEDVHDDMVNGKAGTSTELFDKTQSGLQTPVAATELTLTNKTFTSSNIAMNHLIPLATGNTNTLAEYEINDGVNSFNRAVKATTEKNAKREFNTFHTFDFELVI